MLAWMMVHCHNLPGSMGWNESVKICSSPLTLQLQPYFHGLSTIFEAIKEQECVPFSPFFFFLKVFNSVSLLQFNLTVFAQHFTLAFLSLYYWNNFFFFKY